MGKKRVVITGVGVVSPLGIGKDDFFKAILEGVSGVKEISLFETSAFKTKRAAEISDFRAEDLLGDKGLRNLDRSTRLLSSASALALNDAGFMVSSENSTDIGVAVGTTLGSISSISDFDREALTDGPRYVNPAKFANTVINSPASQVSIRFNIKGFNTTLSSGFCASLDAIGYALDFLRSGRIQAVLAGGVEELCIQTYLAFYKTGCLAGIGNNNLEISCPFDKRRNGVVFGEGSCVLFLEDMEYARRRGSRIYAEVLGFANIFDKGNRINSVKISSLMRRALNDAQVKETDIDYISAAANSSKDLDLSETEAIKELFGDRAYQMKISSVKSMLGECFSVSGAMQAASAIATLKEQAVPPTINYSEKDPLCDLDYTPNKAKPAKIGKVLINAFGKDGNCSCLVIAGYSG